MKNITQILRIPTLVFFLLFGLGTFAQVGIGTITPSAGSIFDVTSTNKGVLVPRVNITNLATIAPVTGGATDGLLVWSTNPTNNGYHYWSVPAGRWIPLTPATATTNDWSILGNANIVNGTNFLGTTNLRNLDFRTNNTLGMRIFGDVAARRGLITVNSAANPFAGDQFTVYGLSAVNGYTTTGFGVYGQANTTGVAVAGYSGSGDAVDGIATTGIGVYGQSNSLAGVFGNTNSGFGVLGISNSFVGVQGESTSAAAVVGLGSTFGTLGQVTGGVGAQGQATTGDGVRGFSTSAEGVYGQTNTSNGVWGQANAAAGIGVRGQSATNLAVFGISTSGEGVQGQSTSGIGTVGLSTSNFGVAGQSDTNIGTLGISDTNNGVQGESNTSAGVRGLGATFGTLGEVTAGVGAQGEATTGVGVGGISVSGPGVVGVSTTGSGVIGDTTDDAVFGGQFTNSGALGHGLVAAGNNQLLTVIPGTGAGITGTGLNIGMFAAANDPIGDGLISVGNNLATYVTDPFGAGSGVVANSDNVGLFAYTTTTVSDGVYGDGGTAAGGTGIRGFGYVGALGEAADPAGFGVLAVGDLGATGGKFFHIDHPLDPSNKYLRHASIESDEILNLYRGTEVFDGSGRAIVSLPDYYDAINKNASYQLTAIGAAMPNLYVEQEITNGQFIIAGGIAGKKVSWQLTAERNDPYLQQNPEKRTMVLDKGEKRGTYLMPGLYGKTKEQGFSYRANVGKVAKSITNTNIHQTTKAEVNTNILTSTEAVRTEKIKSVEKALESKENTKEAFEKAETKVKNREVKEVNETESSKNAEGTVKKLGSVKGSTEEK